MAVKAAGHHTHTPIVERLVTTTTRVLRMVQATLAFLWLCTRIVYVGLLIAGVTTANTLRAIW